MRYHFERMRPRLAIFSAALFPRLGLAFVTFGAVDAVNNLRNFVRILHGQPAITPYLPGIELVLSAASVLAYYTALPLTFAYKLVPVVCDALIAVALYDAESDSRRGLQHGMLYAAAVVPIAISALHPQWESLMLYPLLLALLWLRSDRTRNAALAGAAVVISVIVKPIVPPLIPLLLPRRRKALLWFTAGTVAAAAIYACVIVATSGWLDAQTLSGIVRYAGGGVQLFGLPYRPHNRLIVVVFALMVVAYVFFRGRCSREEGVLFFLTIVIALSGLCVQYLCWLVPLAILCGRIRFLAVYGLVAGVFVIYFYRVPIANLANVDNLATFALLRSLGEFSPPLPAPWAGHLVRLLGNWVLPLLLLSVATYWIAAALRRERVQSPVITVIPSLTIAATAFVLLACVALWTWTRPPIQPEAFVARVEQKVGAYDVVRYRGPLVVTPGAKVWIAGSAADSLRARSLLNLGNLMLAWVVVSSAATAIIARR